MPIPRSCLGNSVAFAPPTVADTRWLLSYAAAVGDGDNPFYTSVAGPAVPRKTHDFHGSGVQGTGVMAHPLFCVAVEWPLMWRQAGGGALLAPRKGSGEIGLAAGEGGRGLHYSEDIIIHRPISANDAIATDCAVVAIRRRKRGTFVQYRFDHRMGTTGELLCTTWNGTYFRGVGISGGADGEQEWVVRESLPPPLPQQQQRQPWQQRTVEPAFALRLAGQCLQDEGLQHVVAAADGVGHAAELDLQQQQQTQCYNVPACSTRVPGVRSP